MSDIVRLGPAPNCPHYPHCPGECVDVCRACVITGVSKDCPECPPGQPDKTTGQPDKTICPDFDPDATAEWEPLPPQEGE